MNGLLFITHQTEQYSYLQSVEIALQGGCRQVQLRMKDTSLEEVETVAKQALQLCNTYNADLYIDDYVEVCRRVGAKGVHLGKHDMPPAEARKLLGSGFVIGGTANTFSDIQYLHAQGVDYVGLGPFRYTTTKKNLSPILGLEGYKSIVSLCKKNAITLPVFTIGGITVDDIPDIMRAGVSGIALSSTILSAANPVGEAKRIVDILNQYKL